MNVLIYNVKNYEEPFFNTAEQPHNFCFTAEPLTLATVNKAKGYDAICCFVTDCLNSDVMTQLAQTGVKLIALRTAGFDHVDLVAAKSVGMTVVRVPSYSPEAIAEFAVALILVLGRQILKSYLHGLDNNFCLDELIGFNLHKKTVGIIGTGNIGTAFAKIMQGFGCRLLAVDPVQNEICRNLKVNYVSLANLLMESDVISLHCPLNNETRHLMNAQAFAQVKKGAMLINTGRGALCDTHALIQALESGKLGYAGLDVYEKEKEIFFQDHRGQAIEDELFVKLHALPNVIITPHQAFLTKEAVENIVKITIQNITAFERGRPINQVDLS